MKHYKDNAEYVEIYVESKNVSMNLRVRKDLVEEYGGIDNVKEHCEGIIMQLNGDLLLPHLRATFNKLDADASRKRIEIIKEAKSRDGGLSSLVH